MRQSLITAFIFVCIFSVVTLFFTTEQVVRENQRLTADLQYRTTLIADSLKEKIEPFIQNNNSQSIQWTIDKFIEDQRIAGILLYDNKDAVIASSSGVVAPNEQLDTLVSNTMDEDKVGTDFISIDKKKMYVFIIPLHQETNVIGSLVLTQNATFIDDRLNEIWKNNLIRLSIQAALILLAIFLTLRFIIYQPIRDLVQTIQTLRQKQVDISEAHRLPGNFFLRPLIREIIHVNQRLAEARQAASQEAKLRLEKIDSPWTSQRLQEFTKKTIKERKIVVVSNREPYIHTKKGDNISYYIPASGMVTAIEPMIEACGGLWIAHGSGDADRMVVDKADKIRVPPDEPKYTLRRVWLSPEEEKRYYYGFSNEGIWPLCHIAHTRPNFREEDWHSYKSVNGKFAETVLTEIKDVQKPIILIQDYHLAALPNMVKNARPDATVGIFWHIPWPNPESFGICPFRSEILDGMLGADLIGFHTQLHCNNFIETVGRELESLIDLEQFSVTRKAHKSFIKPFPISIAFPAQGSRKLLDNEKIWEKLDKKRVKYVGLGVDRLDYTKGILEKLRGVELLLEKNKSYINNFIFVQIAPLSRGQIVAYKKYGERVEQEVQRINSKFQSNGWQPIILLKKHHTHEEIQRFYHLANMCLVTSLHDGMNLVAKEYIASRDDEQGVLILSKFAGASRELKDALIINPYDIHELTETMNVALNMSLMEQKNRMKRMRDSIQTNNIYRWSAEILKVLAALG